jgi:hypothetical protein
MVDNGLLELSREYSFLGIVVRKWVFLDKSVANNRRIPVYKYGQKDNAEY